MGRVLRQTMVPSSSFLLSSLELSDTKVYEPQLRALHDHGTAAERRRNSLKGLRTFT